MIEAMGETAEVVSGAGPILLLCDHASNHVPPDIMLGVAPALMHTHIAVDLGAAALTRALAARLRGPAVLGVTSRLVIDLNRPADAPDLVPLTSDGVAIPGNAGADRARRIARFHAPYHAGIAAHLRRARPRLIVAIHSFTPRLETGGAPRPWPVGILYNRQTVAARLAIAALAREGLMVGDNQPYSGRVLNMTLNRHGEGNGIPSFAIEVRNDGLADAAGVTKWADCLDRVVRAVADELARRAPPLL